MTRSVGCVPHQEMERIMLRPVQWEAQVLDAKRLEKIRNVSHLVPISSITATNNQAKPPHAIPQSAARFIDKSDTSQFEETLSMLECKLTGRRRRDRCL